MGVDDVAAYAGVSRPLAAEWASAWADWPEPFAVLAAGTVWATADVRAVLARHERSPGEGPPPAAAQRPVGVRALPELSRAAADVRSLLDGVRESLDLDAAFIAEFVGDQEVFRVVAGDGAAFAASEGGTQALCDTYCARVVSGVLPNLIADARQHPVAREVPATRLRGIRAYIGVPLQRPDGTLYGTVCGLAQTPRPDLTSQQVGVLAEFGRRISPLLHHAHLAAAVQQADG
jgi:GAF domain-containing protein